MENQWIEIFRAGNYPQGEYTVDDLDTMVGDYSPDVFEAPVTKEHEQWGPAYGWVAALKREGDVLLAQLCQVSDELRAWVKTGAYKKRSVEIYDNFQGTGKRYLRSLSFLGAQPEQVKGMKPIAFGSTAGTFSSFTDFSPALKELGLELKKMAEFTDEQVQKMVETAVASATAQMTEQLRVEREGREKLEERTRRDDIRHFCDSLLVEGKSVAAWRDVGIEGFIYALDMIPGNKMAKFGETEKSLGMWFREFVKKFTTGVELAGPKKDWIPSEAGKSPKDILDHRIAAFQEKNPAIGYVDALIAVTRQDSLLGEEYLDSVRGNV